MQQSLTRHVPVQQLLRQIASASDRCVWQPWWTHLHNQPNHADLSALLESPSHILELEDWISSVESSVTFEKGSISFFRLVGGSEIGGSYSAESNKCITQGQNELSLGRCYWGRCLHFLYIGPWCYEFQAWSHGWHRYILPCNQVLDAQQMKGSAMLDGSTTPHSKVS